MDRVQCSRRATSNSLLLLDSVSPRMVPPGAETHPHMPPRLFLAYQALMALVLVGRSSLIIAFVAFEGWKPFVVGLTSVDIMISHYLWMPTVVLPEDAAGSGVIVHSHQGLMQG